MGAKSIDDRETDPARATAAESCCDDALSLKWYENLRNEVDYHSTFCEGLHLEISELTSKLKEAYAATARSMKGLYDSKEIANRWFGLWCFASELLATARAANEAHQICGADLSELEQYQQAAWERFQLHCPQELNVT